MQTEIFTDEVIEAWLANGVVTETSEMRLDVAMDFGVGQ
jgi:hypothetical protein